MTMIRRLNLLLAAFAAFAPAFAMADATRPADDPLPRKQDRPLENLDGVRTTYGSVMTSGGVRLRTLISTAESSKKKLRPILFTQWVSCDSVEYEAGDGASEILAELARRSGLAVVRVERRGTGDSQGAGCDALDYETELNDYIDAYRAVLASGAVDPSRVYVYGSSLGATTAPLLARALEAAGYDVAGVAVQGGGALTHFERMLSFDRLYLERRPAKVARADIHRQMLDRAVFQTEYLIKGRSPDAIAKDSATMAAVRADTRGLGAKDHYGRPFAWHQQAAQRDFLGAWAALDADVLVIFNGFDQFETRHGHALIVETVNRVSPGAAQLIENASLDHSSRRFTSADAAYAGKDGAGAWREVADQLVLWFAARTK
jgi:hypothetical protein